MPRRKTPNRTANELKRMRLEKKKIQLQRRLRLSKLRKVKKLEADVCQTQNYMSSIQKKYQRDCKNFEKELNTKYKQIGDIEKTISAYHDKITRGILLSEIQLEQMDAKEHMRALLIVQQNRIRAMKKQESENFYKQIKRDSQVLQRKQLMLQIVTQAMNQEVRLPVTSSLLEPYIEILSDDDNADGS